jgi:hypothetical protein
MIPGSNILAQALSVITPTTVTYYKALERTVNEVGIYVTQYDEGACISGSLQPVPMALYQQLNLDFMKRYYKFYTSTVFEDVTRDKSGDQLEFDGNRYQVVDLDDWNKIDGWNGVLVVLI